LRLKSEMQSENFVNYLP